MRSTCLQSCKSTGCNEVHSGGSYICAPAVLTGQASGRRAAEQLLVEVLSEAFAHQVEGEWVHTGVGEGQNASAHAGDEVAQRGVHLVVVVGAVQVDHMTGQPAHGKQADKHQHSFGQTPSGLDLRREEGISDPYRNISITFGWIVMKLCTDIYGFRITLVILCLFRYRHQHFDSFIYNEIARHLLDGLL